MELKKRTVLFINNDLSTFFVFRKDVADNFLRHGWHVALVVPNKILDTSMLRAVDERIEIIGVEMQPTGSNPFKDLAFFLSLRRIIKKISPDIIFNYTIKPNIYGTFAAVSLGIRNVAMVAGLGYMFESNSLLKKAVRLLYKAALRSADKVMVLNQDNRDLLVNNKYVLKDNLILMHGGEGVNLEDFPYEEKSFDTTKFLMVARILYDKGYSEYVEAARLVKKKYPNVEISLLGPLDESSPMGVPKSVLDADVRDNAINYLGVTSNVPSFLGEDGVVAVLPSYYHEGLNRSLMEATAMGCPVITSDSPGCRETVDEGINGYLVPKKDSKALADAMIRFLELDQEQKREMSRKSWKKAKAQFDMKFVIDHYGKIIKDVLG